MELEQLRGMLVFKTDVSGLQSATTQLSSLQRASSQTMPAIVSLGRASKEAGDDVAKLGQQSSGAATQVSTLGKAADQSLGSLGQRASIFGRLSSAASGFGGVFSGVVGKLQEAGSGLASMFSSVDTSLNKMGLSLRGLSFAGVAAGLAAISKEAINAAGNLSDLSASTGLTTTELQRIEVAGRKTGVGLDTAARGIQMLQRNIANGDEGALKAITDLGLSLDGLLQQSPGEMFEELARSIAKIPDPIKRTQTAYELLGRSGGQLLPLLLSDIDGLNAGVTKMSAETVANLDRLGDAWDTVSISMRNAAGQAIGIITSGGEVNRQSEAQVHMLRSSLGGGLIVGLHDLADSIQGVKLAYEGLNPRLAETNALLTPFAANIKNSALGARGAKAALEAFDKAHGSTGKMLEESSERYQKHLEKEAEKLQRIADMHARVREESAAWRRQQDQRLDRQREKEALDAMKAAEDFAKGLKKDMIELQDETAKWGTEITKALRGFDLSKTPGFTGPDAIDKAMRDALPKQSAFGKAMSSTLKNVALQFPNMLADAIIHGRGFSEALRGVLASSFGNAFAEFGKGLVGKGTSKLGGIAGDLLGGVFGMAGSIVGDLLGKGMKALVDSFRGEGAKANDLRDELMKDFGGDWKKLSDQIFDAFGVQGLGSRLSNALDDAYTRFISGGSQAQVQKGFDDMKRILAEISDWQKRLQGGFANLLTATGEFGDRAPSNMHGMIRELLSMNGLTREQKMLLEDLMKPAGVDAMREAAQNLGIEFKNLGIGFQQADITETALGYARSLTLLDEANALTNEGLRDSADSLIELGKRAIANQTILPESLRPFFQRLKDLGFLVDDAGEELLDFGQLQFGEVIDETFKDMLKALQEIRDVLRESLPAAAEEGATRIRRAFGGTFEINTRVNPPSSASGPANPTGPNPSQSSFTTSTGAFAAQSSSIPTTPVVVVQIGDRTVKDVVTHTFYQSHKENDSEGLPESLMGEFAQLVERATRASRR